MTKDLPRWAYSALATCGAVLVASMLFLWIDLGFASERGISLAFGDNHWLLLVPVIGAALVAAASTRSSYTRLVAIAAGLAVAGYTLFNIASSLVQSDLGTWLVLGGAGLLLSGTRHGRTTARALGAIALLVGFFEPWGDFTLFDAAWHSGLSSLAMLGLWLIPAAGVAGLLSAGSKQAGALAGVAGATVYGVLAWVILAAAWQIFGIGAWAALGASTVALVIGVLAQAAPVVAAAPKTELAS